MVSIKDTDKIEYDEALDLMIEYRNQYGFRLLYSEDIEHFVAWFENALVVRLLGPDDQNPLATSCITPNREKEINKDDWECVRDFMKSELSMKYTDNDYNINDIAECLREYVYNYAFSDINDDIYLHVSDRVRELFGKNGRERELHRYINDTVGLLKEDVYSMIS